MKVLLFVFTLLLAVNVTSAQENIDETTRLEKQYFSTAIVSIDGMACQEGCADKISSNLRNITGVSTAEVSYTNKEAIITFNAEIVTALQLKNIITNTKVKEYVYSINSFQIKK